jgi:hypothetical protein
MLRRGRGDWSRRWHSTVASKPEPDGSDLRSPAWKRRRADYKLIKELTDVVFRIVQMWAVIAIVWFLHLTLGHWAAALVAIMLIFGLIFYSLTAPHIAVLDWREARNETKVGRWWHVFWITNSVIVLILVFNIDPIVYAFNAKEMGDISKGVVDP